jgi:probable rRNA maturation factor
VSAKPRVSLAIQYAVAPATLPGPAALRRWARAAVDRDAAVTLRFVGAREGRTLNARYRGKPHATNVLAFVYDEAGRLEGDVVLCAPVLRQEAKSQGKPLAHHCAHLVVHGMLHLQGYDHDTDRAARAMEARESAILAALGVPDPYAPPGAAPR